MQVTNTTGAEFANEVDGQRFDLAPGQSVTVSDRTALMLGEYGLTIADERSAIVNQEAATPTPGERRLTSGRQHVSDDPRANTPGTPVGVTGDTGATDPDLVLSDPGAVVEAQGDGTVVAVEPVQSLDQGDALELKGDALKEAVAAANEQGAEIGSDLTADEKRSALHDWYNRA